MYYICKPLKKVDMFKRGKFAVAIAVLVVLFQVASLAQNSISGVVSYHNDPSKPMQGVEVMLYDMGGDLVETIFTNESGKYLFEGLEEEEYLLKSKYEQPLGFNIDLNDILMLLDYLNGNLNLEPIQLLAADVDGDGLVDWRDFEIVVNTYYLHQQSYPVGDWVFSDVLVSISGKESENTAATGSGDVNGSFGMDKKSFSIAGTPSNEVLTAFHQELFNFTVSIRNIKSLIGSYYLILNYDNTIVNIESINSEIDGFEYIIEESEIRIMWVDKLLQGINMNKLLDLFSIKMSINCDYNGIENNLFTINSKSSIVDIDGNTLNNIALNFPTVNVVSPIDISAYPNPGIDYTNIEFSLLDNGGRVTLIITDLNGIVVRSITQNEYYSKGTYTKRINKGELASGIYFYSLSIYSDEKRNFKGKIIFMD